MVKFICNSTVAKLQSPRKPGFADVMKSLFRQHKRLRMWVNKTFEILIRLHARISRRFIIQVQTVINVA